MKPPTPKKEPIVLKLEDISTEDKKEELVNLFKEHKKSYQASLKESTGTKPNLSASFLSSFCALIRPVSASTQEKSSESTATPSEEKVEDNENKEADKKQKNERASPSNEMFPPWRRFENNQSRKTFGRPEI